MSEKSMVYIYGLDGEGAEFVSAAATIAKEIALPSAADVDEKARFPEESISALAKGGLFGLCLSREFGGKGQRESAFAAVVEEIAGSCPSSAMIYVMHVSASQAIAASPRLAGRDDILRDIAE